MTVRDLISALTIYNPHAEVKLCGQMHDGTFASFVWSDCNAFYEDENFTLELHVALEEGVNDDAN